MGGVGEGKSKRRDVSSTIVFRGVGWGGGWMVEYSRYEGRVGVDDGSDVE